MAYVPPHRRHSGHGDATIPVPLPDSLNRRFDETLQISSEQRRKHRFTSKTDKYPYAKNAVSKWFPVGSSCDDDPVPASFRLEPFPRAPAHLNGEQAFVLVGDCVHTPSDGSKSEDDVDKEPWLLITKRILSDLLPSFQSLMDVVRTGDKAMEPYLVVRVGKVLFHGASIDSIRKVALLDTGFRYPVRKSFHADVPKAHMEDLKNLITQKTGMCSERYLVKISDETMPGSVLMCRCQVADGGKLKIYKVELNQLRHLVVDVSCLSKDLDLRLMLCCRRRRYAGMEDEEKESIEKLIDAAVIDPHVKGGLRWPLGGEESTGNRFRVISSWHVKYVLLKEPDMKIKLRIADRFDFLSSTGEVSYEVYLKLTELKKLLEIDAVEPDHVEEVLRRTTKHIWENFLDCNHEFT